MVGARGPCVGNGEAPQCRCRHRRQRRTPQLALAFACLVQTNSGPTRLFSALLCGSNHGIDTRSRTAKAIEYLLDSDHSLIVKCIINSEHYAIDCTGIITLAGAIHCIVMHVPDLLFRADQD